MLRSLYVKNLALIEEIEVEFEKGLNILTGETGAGKSIILGSVQLALGGRYTADLLRKGKEFGFVELVFHLENDKQIQELKELDIIPEDGMIILSRKLMEGRSISKINGETVTQTVLKNVASVLIDIHGQHEHQTLLNKKNHLAILDEYIGDEGVPLKKQVADSYKLYKSKVQEMNEADNDIESRNRELSFLQFELNEIAEANLVKGEDEDLEHSYRRLVNGKKITENLDCVYNCTSSYGDYGASDALSRGLHALQEISEYDDTCKQFYHQLAEVDNLLNDFNREVSTYKDNIEFLHEDFQTIEERLNLWNRLKGKYGKTFDDIMEYRSGLEEKTSKLLDYDAYLIRLNDEITVSYTALENTAKTLSKCRVRACEKLSEAIKENLKELNFNDVNFQINIEEKTIITNDGIDEVMFLVSLNPGEDVKPLSNVVSGGELSRIMLAIKTVMADKEQKETLIFDEVDAGISGLTASKVGEKLAIIGKSRQVICITHLAQIAALASEHFVIQKQVHAGKSVTSIAKLSYQEAIDELTRILGGGQATEAMVQSAIEMKEMANRKFYG